MVIPLHVSVTSAPSVPTTSAPAPASVPRY